MGQPGTVEIKFARDKHLRFRLQTSKRGTVNDTVSINLEMGAKIVRLPKVQRLEVE
jgi:hypothetical protein